MPRSPRRAMGVSAATERVTGGFPPSSSLPRSHAARLRWSSGSPGSPRRGEPPPRPVRGGRIGFWPGRSGDPPVVAHLVVIVGTGTSPPLVAFRSRSRRSTRAGATAAVPAPRPGEGALRRPFRGCSGSRTGRRHDLVDRGSACGLPRGGRRRPERAAPQMRYSGSPPSRFGSRPCSAVQESGLPPSRAAIRTCRGATPTSYWQKAPPSVNVSRAG